MRKDWLLVDRVALVAFVLLVALATYGYVVLPESIPTSFSLSGEPRAYSSKLMVFLEPVMAAFACAITALATRGPMRLNPPFEVPPERMELVLPIGAELIRAVRLVLILGFTLIEWSTFESSRLGRLDASFPFAIGAVIVGILATVVLYTARIWRVARG